MLSRSSLAPSAVRQPGNLLTTAQQQWNPAASRVAKQPIRGFAVLLRDWQLCEHLRGICRNPHGPGLKPNRCLRPQTSVAAAVVQAERPVLTSSTQSPASPLQSPEQSESDGSSEETASTGSSKETTSTGSSKETASSGSSVEASSSGRGQFCVVNFYHLADLQDPFAVIRQHRQWLDDRDILGRIYITYQGINAQLSGPQADAHAYAEWVLHQPEFQGLRWTSDPVEAHQFPRLRLKYRETLVQLAGGTRSLPITDEKARAKPLAPNEWQAMLRDAISLSSSMQGDEEALQRRPVVLDVRNSYEWDAGHFRGAERPVEVQFNQTPTSEVPAALQGAPRDTPVMMYCTGGIRCDIYSAYLRQQGFDNLYTLHGGIANYLRQLGNKDWNGSLFTFDDRLAVSPDGRELRPGAVSAASPCQCCGGKAILPHMNCANIDCNKLFLACPTCQETWKGCCSRDCMDAPRFVRPPKSEGHYSSWHTLAEKSELEEVKEAIRRGRGPGRLAKRQRRLERLRAKQAEKRDLKAKRRQLSKAAMAAVQEKAGNERDERLSLAA